MFLGCDEQAFHNVCCQCLAIFILVHFVVHNALLTCTFIGSLSDALLNEFSLVGNSTYNYLIQRVIINKFSLVEHSKCYYLTQRVTI